MQPKKFVTQNFQTPNSKKIFYINIVYTKEVCNIQKKMKKKMKKRWEQVFFLNFMVNVVLQKV